MREIQIASKKLTTGKSTRLMLASVLVGALLSACSSNDPATESDVYLDGVGLYNAKNYSGAVAHFKDEITSYPAGDFTDDAYFYLGKSEYWLKDYVAASADFGTLLTDFPTSDILDKGQYWKAKTLHQQNNFVDARTAYQAVVTHNATSSYLDDAAYGVAKTYYDEKNYASAEIEFANVLAPPHVLNSKSDNSQYYYAKSLHAQGKFPEARTEYEALISNVDYATSGWLDNAQSQIWQTYMDAGDFTGAIASINALLADPNASLANKELAQYNLGDAYHQNNDFVKARVEYNKLIATYSTSLFVDDAHYQIGKTYYEEARIAASAALAAIPPTIPDAKLYDLAIPDFQKAVAMIGSSSADNAQLYIGKARHKQAQLSSVAADYDVARAEYAKLNTTTYPGSSKLDNAIFEIGKTHYDEANYDLAIVEFDKVVTDYSAGGSADNSLYYKGHSLRKLATAATTPDYAAARATYGLVITNYLTSTKADNAQYYIGYTYHLEGNCTQEQTEMQKVVTNYASSTYAVKAQGHIDAIVAATHTTCI
ncbi:MAG: tetratricopeptide repeat protein [Gammaproteobacteria bacterium]|nr:tetratricopeptide repeat protein [Gammaproteobacteria bacterium]